MNFIIQKISHFMEQRIEISINNDNLSLQE